MSLFGTLRTGLFEEPMSGFGVEQPSGCWSSTACEVARWSSNPSEERSYKQNKIRDQQERETPDAMKLRDVAINRQHR
jgi:hypothetical protein